MANKVFRQGNYLIIENSVSSEVMLSKYAANVLIEPDGVNPNIFRFYYIDSYQDPAERREFLHSDIGDLIDSASVAYTKVTFIEFYTSNTGPVYDPSVGGVTSVNGQTGVVVLDADDIDDSATVNKFSSNFNIDLDSSEASVVRVFAGGRTTYTITHALNSLDVTAQTFRLSNGRTVGLRVERTGVNTIEVSRSGNSADGIYRVLIGKIG